MDAAEAMERQVDATGDFSDFFAAEYETLLKAMFLLSGDAHEAEELTQDAFVKVLERWDRVQRMQNRQGYLYRIAVNARRSAFRRVRTATRRMVSSPASADPLTSTEERDMIRRALETLPPNQREALVLMEWLSFTDTEAGRILGVSPGAVRVRSSRARASMRRSIEGVLDD